MKRNVYKNNYSFGAAMPGRSFVGANGYRYGFNGKEKDDETSGSGNEYDYGFRIYNPRLGRFLSVDPITRKYPMLSSYQFAGNNPIQFIDLDGLEPALPKQGAKYLVIVIQGYAGFISPDDNMTQAKNAVRKNPGAELDMKGLGSISTLDSPETQVVVFASSDVENTKDDVIATINGFKTANEKGKIILVGHSLGGDNIIEIVKENNDLEVDLLIPVDATDLLGDISDNNIPGNVKNVINYRQNGDTRVQGEKLDILDPDKTKSADLLYGNKHDEIDNIAAPMIKQDIKNFIAGKDVTKAATETYNKQMKPKADSKTK